MKIKTDIFKDSFMVWTLRAILLIVALILLLILYKQIIVTKVSHDMYIAYKEQVEFPY